MQNSKVIFGPGIDAALLALIDYVDVDSIPSVLKFIEDIQLRLVNTLATFPQSGRMFQGGVRMFAVDDYIFLYEHHADLNEVHVLEMIQLRRNWR